MDTVLSEYTTVEQPSVKLNNGLQFPLMGLGTWKASPGDAGKIVSNALKAGFRHLDFAMMYGNQAEIGEALTAVFKEGKVKREDVWMTSKLDNEHHASGDVEKAARKVLKDLQQEYIDLFLIHWPVVKNCKGDTLKPSIKETWQAMEKLVDEGLVKSIGISNFSVEKIKDMLTFARIKPAVHQIEVHPMWSNQYNLDFCHKEGIHVTAYSPLGSPDSAEMMKRSHKEPLMQNAKVQEVASKHNKAAAEVLLAWGLQHDTSVIPKTTKVKNLKANLDVLKFKLPEEDYKSLCGISPQERMVDGSFMCDKEGPYKNMHELWDGEETQDSLHSLMGSLTQKATTA
ncbi:g13073 [Coccomyxa viridis]|uniref:G13073 protein n=1 Tax=Coccomyxa viridis TaxID=1274662 RepID=A0ABP1GBW9_9CHLO